MGNMEKNSSRFALMLSIVAMEVGVFQVALGALYPIDPNEKQPAV